RRHAPGYPRGRSCHTEHKSGNRLQLSLSRVTPPAASERFSELIGCPISRSLATSCVCLELRLLPSTGITRFQRYNGPLRHPRTPGLSSRQGASRVACAFLVYMLPPLPRRGSWASSSLFRPAVSAFPGTAAGSARASSFSRLAQRSLTLRPAHLRCHQFVT